jgi:hypothetical protein
MKIKETNIALQYGLKDKKGEPIEIPLGGSMGLLAIGYRGLMAWRAKKNQYQQNKTNGKA